MNETRKQQIAKGAFDLVAADIVNRSVAWELRRRMGLTPVAKAQIVSELVKYLKEFSTPDGYISTVANGIVSVTYSESRDEVFEEFKNQVRVFEYSSVLDSHTCFRCAEDDGLQAVDIEDLPPAPNPDCQGGLRCRCIHVAILKSEQQAKA